MSIFFIFKIDVIINRLTIIIYFIDITSTYNKIFIHTSYAVYSLYSDGKFTYEGECVLFPSREQRDWYKFKIPIITKSTFNNKAGTVITDIIEENIIKSVVKKDISRISIVGNGIIRNMCFIKKVLDIVENEKLEMLEFNVSESKISIDFKFMINDKVLDKINNLLNRKKG